jgi:hypothetical protein
MEASWVAGTCQSSQLEKKKTRSHRVNKEPILANGFLVEKEGCPSKSLIEEICSQSCDPFKYGEPGARLENEQGNSLLEEETYYYGWPSFESVCILGEGTFQFTKVFQPDCWR